MIAITAVATVPADTGSLTVLPWLHPFAYSIHNSDDFMSRHTRVLDSGPEAFFDQRITVTNAARFNLDPHPAPLRLGDVAFD